MILRLFRAMGDVVNDMLASRYAGEKTDLDADLLVERQRALVADEKVKADKARAHLLEAQAKVIDTKGGTNGSRHTSPVEGKAQGHQNTGRKGG